MRFKAAIFDMDGTLLESMHIWQNLAPDFLKKHRIDPGKDFAIHSSIPSVRGAVDYMIKTFSLDLDPEAETAAIYASLDEFYRKQVKVKPGIKKLLDKIVDSGIRCGVLTATEPDLAALALESTGLAEYFSGRILSGAEHKISKSTPLPFQMMCEILQSSPENTVVFEDALYAARCAAGTGFAVAAIYDPSEPAQADLAGIANWYCKNWNDFPLTVFD